MMTLIDAHDAVLDLVPVDLDPVLTPAEVDAALVRTQLAAIWTPSTAYSVGQKVVPVAPMGRVFICVLPGTSDVAEPAWLIAPSYTGPVNPIGAWWGVGPMPFVGNAATTPWLWGLGDGTTAWRDYGPFAGEIYDVMSAAAECFRLKARKVANRYDVSVPGGPNARRSQMYDALMAQARSLTPIRIV